MLTGRGPLKGTKDRKFTRMPNDPQASAQQTQRQIPLAAAPGEFSTASAEKPNIPSFKTLNRHEQNERLRRMVLAPEQLATLLAGVGPKDVVDIVYNLATSKRGGQLTELPRLWETHVFAASERWLPALTPRQLATVMWSIAILGFQPSGTFLQHWFHWSFDSMQQSNCQDLSQSIWSLVKLGVQPDMKWLNGVLKRFSHQWHRASSQSCANMIWAVAKSGRTISSLWVERFTAHVCAHLHKLPPRHLSQILWSLSELGCQPRHDHLVKLTSAVVRYPLEDLTPQDICMMLKPLQRWGYTPDEPYMNQLYASTLIKLTGFDPTAIVSFLVILAKLRASPPPSWLEVCVAQFLADRGQATTQQIAAFTWAVGALNPLALTGPQVSMLQEAFSLKLTSASCQAVSTMAHAINRPGVVFTQSFFPELLLRYLEVMHEATSHTLAVMLWCMARGRQTVSRELLMQAVRHSKVHILRQLSSFSHHQLMVVLWSLVILSRQTSIYSLDGDKQHALLMNLIFMMVETNVPWSSSQLRGVALALVRLGYCPAGHWWRDYLERGVLSELDPQAVSTILWAVRKLSAPVDTRHLRSFLAASQPLVELFDHQSLAMSLWAISKRPLEVLPPGWLQQWTSRVVSQLDTFSPQELTAVLHAWSRLYSSRTDAEDIGTSITRRTSLAPEELPGTHVVQHKVAMADRVQSGRQGPLDQVQGQLGVNLPGSDITDLTPTFLRAFFASSLLQLASYSPHQLAITSKAVWQLHLSYTPPSDWCQALLSRVMNSVDEWHPVYLGQVIHDMHDIMVDNGQSWRTTASGRGYIEGLVSGMQDKLCLCTSQQLAYLVKVLARSQVVVSSSWLDVLARAVLATRSNHVPGFRELDTAEGFGLRATVDILQLLELSRAHSPHPHLYQMSPPVKDLLETVVRSELMCDGLGDLSPHEAEQLVVSMSACQPYMSPSWVWQTYLDLVKHVGQQMKAIASANNRTSGGSSLRQQWSA